MAAVEGVLDMASKAAPKKFEFPRIVWAVIEGDGDDRFAGFYLSIDDLPDDQNNRRVMVFTADQEYTLHIGKVLL